MIGNAPFNFKQLLIASVCGIVLAAGAHAGRENGGGGSSPGGGGSGAAPDLGDLFVLYRDARGVPYLTADSCWQPLPSETCVETCTLVPGVPAGPDVIPVDPATCAVAPACTTCTQEVDFGRTNVARTSDAVFASQLEDAVVNLATADCTSLDPAGRMVTSTVTATDGGTVVSSSAIDSPLQNLAIYKQLMKTGSIGTPLPQGAGVFDTAARGFGAGVDKGGEVTVDHVAYLNQILGLTDPATPTYLPKICSNMKQEVAGQVTMVQKCYLSYGQVPPNSLAYYYNRDTNFGGLPAPAYIPEGDATAGAFEYLAVLDSEVPSFVLMQGSILDAVFKGNGYEGSNIGAFTQAADDARAVINFMHTWPVPVGFETPVPCDVDPGEVVTYDVSISTQSGLQVPTRIVDGTEGREFIVTVANAGPDAATGTVTVIATAASGGAIVGSPWVFNFTDVAPGASKAFTQFFSINLGQSTTISWTATASAPYDVNLSNNIVTASSRVNVSTR